METTHFPLLKYCQFAAKPRPPCAFQFFHISDILLCQKRPFLTVAKNALYGAAALIFTGFYPQSALGDDTQAQPSGSFKNKDFLQLKKNEKKFFLFGVIETLWQIEALRDKKAGQCVADWYYKDMANKDALILAYMKKYPDLEPNAILITLTEKACNLPAK